MFYNALSGFNAFTLPVVAGGYIVSVQQFSITIAAASTSNTATISSVDTSKSFIIYNGENTARSLRDGEDMLASLTLTNSTTVTANRNGNTSDHIIYGTVVEFNSSFISSVQQGSITLTAPATSNTATISSVDTSRSFVLWCGASSTVTGTDLADMYTALDLTNSTTVTSTFAAAGTLTLTTRFVVVELQAAVVTSLQQAMPTSSGATATMTATISSVDTSKTAIFWGGHYSDQTAFTQNFMRADLTNSTTVTLTRAGTSAAVRGATVTVIEFATGVLAQAPQQGTATLVSVATLGTTITSVNTAKSVVPWLGSSMGSITDPRLALLQNQLTNSTTVTTTVNTSTAVTKSANFQVLEFN